MTVCIIAAFFTNRLFEVTHIPERSTVGTTDMFLVRWAVTFIRPLITSIAEAFVSAVNISTRVEVYNRIRNHTFSEWKA